MRRPVINQVNRKTFSVGFAAITFCIIASGCTSKELYNAVQQNRLQKCSELYGPQREECEAQYQKDFETYNREREEVIANEPPA